MTRKEHLGPYLLGTYESELDSAWEVLFKGVFLQVINVGARFGYYAVGLAKRFPQSRVVALDTDWWARQAIREMALANQVANVEVMGACDPDWLDRNLCEGALIISDCEGYEGELFCSKQILHLPSAALIIEMHEELCPGVSDRVLDALRPTHEIWEKRSGSGPRGVTRDLSFLTSRERNLALQEGRPPQRWLLCLPNYGPNKALQSIRAARLGPE